jgi:uridine phosphorylase
MASHLAPDRWQGSPLVTARRLIEHFGASRPLPHVSPRVVIADTPAILNRWAKAHGKELQKALGMKFLNAGGTTIVSSSGPGAPSTAFALEVIKELGAERVIHLGAITAIQGALRPGDVVIADAAYRDDGVSIHYLPPGDLVIGDSAEATNWKSRLAAEKFNVHRGAVWTSSAVFRGTADAVKVFQGRGVLGTDTDAATALAVAAVQKFEVVCLRVVTDLLTAHGWQPHFETSPVRQSRWRLFELVVKDGR